MKFDVEGARKAGYTDAEIAAHLATSKQFDADAARKSGYSDAEIISHLADGGEKGYLRKALDAGSAILSGVNRSLISRAGLPFNPVDVAANVIDLGKAAVGAPYVAATGKPPPAWLEVGDRSNAVGSGAWLLKQVGRTQTGRNIINPTDQSYEGGLLQAAGSGFGNSPANYISGPLGAVASQAVGEATNSPALAITAGMAPMAAARGANLVGQKLATPQDPRTAELAREAVNRYGIPLSLSDTTDSKFIKTVSRVMEDTPLLGMIGGGQQQAKQAAFNKAVGSTFGAPVEDLSSSARVGARAQIGGKLDELWNKNNVVVDGRLFQELQKARADAAQLPSGGRERVLRWVNDIESQMTPGPGGVPTIPGAVANKYQSTLGRESRTITDGFVQESLGGLQKSLIGAFNRSVAPSDASALSDARGQYKAFKTVDPLLEKSAAGVAGRISGDVPAGLLPNAVANSYSGPSVLGDLSQIGSQYLVNRVPITGGSPRAMVQNGLLAGLTIGGTSVFSIPAAVLGAGAAATIKYVMSNPKLAKELLNADGTIKSADLMTLINQAQQSNASPINNQ